MKRLYEPRPCRKDAKSGKEQSGGRQTSSIPLARLKTRLADVYICTKTCTNICLEVCTIVDTYRLSSGWVLAYRLPNAPSNVPPHVPSPLPHRMLVCRSLIRRDAKPCSLCSFASKHLVSHLFQYDEEVVEGAQHVVRCYANRGTGPFGAVR